MNLRKYLGKNVKVIFIDGQILQGYDGKALPSKLLIDNEEAQKIVEQMRLPKGFDGLRPVTYEAEDYIAIFIDPETGEEIKTKFVTVSFRKTGSHLTPKKTKKDKG
ncbi:polymorphic toxin type 50 domain-containing protein [Lactococcus insecticola]|uniref:Uncharacterized protein n=1 Tax=Pseudolactococcus insecticola TaxID=2709158 RepID=A0A6A0B6Y1_9LACT|nr:polymorphic toxin type 50 domain-containing protein [Lactococcus insecticola]GFH40706.1 hypothetical protein Hs20B_11040 [Lactococcus insecticola]